MFTRTRCFFTISAFPLLVACGGRSTSDAFPCPAGDTCSPTEPGGSGPTNDASASGTQPPSGNDAGVGAADDAGYPEGSVPPASSSVAVLEYQVTDAKFSAALSSIVIVSDMPANTLHVYDTKTKSDRTVTLPSIPVAVALDASGLHAAVAYDANVSWVDLTSGTVTTTCPITSDAYDIALTKEGVAYVMPKTDQWVSLHVVDSTCTEMLEGNPVWAASHIALHPSETALFTADQGVSPSSINRCGLTGTPVQCQDALSAMDWGTYGFGGALWVSADGQRIYSATGVTLRIPGNPATDLCTYGGSLSGVTVLLHLSEAQQAGRILLIPGDDGYNPDPIGMPSTADTVVRVHETQYLGFVAQYELPPFPLAGTNTAISHGRFVFATPTMDTIFTIIQADPSSGALNDFAIAAMKP